MIWKSEKADYVIYDQYGWQLPGHLVSPVSGTKDELTEFFWNYELRTIHTA